MDVQTAPQLRKALSHSQQSYSHVRRPLLGFLGRHTATIISNPQKKVAIARRDLDLGRLGSGMAMDIVQGLLDNAEKSEFRIRGWAIERIRRLETDSDARTLAKPIRQPLDRRYEPSFLEKRRMQQLCDGA